MRKSTILLSSECEWQEKQWMRHKFSGRYALSYHTGEKKARGQKGTIRLSLARRELQIRGAETPRYEARTPGSQRIRGAKEYIRAALFAIRLAARREAHFSEGF